MIELALFEGKSDLAILEESLKELRNEGWRTKRIALCECCGTMQSTERRASMTNYHWDHNDPAVEDPNADWDGCEPCWLEHQEHWAGMWSDYYSGLL